MKYLFLSLLLFLSFSVNAQTLTERINQTSTETQPLICQNDTGNFVMAAGTCRIIGTVNSGSGIGVSVNFSISGGTVSYIDVVRDSITFRYDRQVSAHSELSGPCFAAHYTVKAVFTDGTSCTVSTTGNPPHSACTDAALANSVSPVSAASYQEFSAPGGILAVFGNSLTTVTQGAVSIPLPDKLGDVEVYVFKNTPLERKLKLFYVSPTQANVLLPEDLAYGGKATLQLVNTSTDTLKAGFFYSNLREPSMFTQAGQTGNGLAAGYWIGNHVVLFGTGFNNATCAYIQQGLQKFPASFVGFAPGYVGLYQINVPTTLQKGSQVQVVVGCDSNSLRGSQFFQLPF